MDRNAPRQICTIALTVALRKESVDRNWQNIDERETIAASLSARRAWIEIFLLPPALWAVLSLSARRAWIEIIQIES